MAKTVEVDEEELRKMGMLRGTLSKIMSHPEGKLMLEKAHKLVDPTAVTPGLDAVKPVEDRFAKTEDELASLRKQIADDKEQREKDAKLSAMDRKIADGFDKLRRQGVTEEGITGVKKIMDDEGILNPEIAWAHFERQHPPQQPVTPNGSGAWNFLDVQDTDTDLKKLIESKGESAGLVDKMAHDALNEVRGQTRR